MANPDYVAKRNDDYVFNYDPNEDAWSTDLAALDISRSERSATTIFGRSSSGCGRNTLPRLSPSSTRPTPIPGPRECFSRRCGTKQLATDHPDHHFAGMRTGTDLAAHYASADLFLFPSLTETYGNVTAEAMASALPVLAYRSAAAAELIVDGVNGRLVAPGDEEGFRQAALDMLAQADLLPAMGRAARQTMRAHHWGTVVERFESLLCEAIG